MSNSDESDVASDLDNEKEENNDDTSEAESGDDVAEAAKASEDLEKDDSDDKVVTWQDLVCITERLVKPQKLDLNIVI